MRWILVGAVVASTVASDLLQSSEMKRQAARGKYGASWLLALAVVFMAVSFFSLLKLLEIAELSFAVPATAASLALETVLAKFLLKEHVDWRRWTGAALVAVGVALLGQE
jgi:drug/metabolite transporter (DMT)-like permease